MYSVRDGSLYFNERCLGSAKDLYVDYHQDLADHPGLVRTRLDVGDYVFVNGETIVVIEEKKLNDMLSSWRARRLQRQLRSMQASNPNGANVLALRGGEYGALFELYQQYVPPEISVDLLKWQVLGGVVGALPQDGERAYRTLLVWRSVLKPGRHLLSVVSGKDEVKVRERMTPTALALRHLLKGVGYETATRWAEAAKQNLIKALTMTDEQLTKAKVNKGIIKELRKVVHD